MRGGLIFRVAAALCLFGASSAARAQDEDTQLWVYGVAATDLGEDTRLTIDATARWREEQRGDEQHTVRATVMHQIAEGVRIGGGGGVFETEGGRTELRPHQQISLRTGRFSARTRFEQRFFDGADRMELRIRQMVRYAQPISYTFSLSLDGEYLGLVQTRERGGTRPRDQWRARAIVSADVSDDLTLGAGYLMVVTPREGTADQIAHVPQLYLTLDF